MSAKTFTTEFQLAAQLNSSFGGSFSTAQSSVLKLQNEMRELNKVQSDITSFERQQRALNDSKSNVELYEKQINNLKEAQKEAGADTVLYGNKILELEQKKDKVNAKIKEQEERLGKTGEKLREAGVDTDQLGEASKKTADKIEELKKEQQGAAESSEKMGQSGAEAAQTLMAAFAAAGIANILKEIAQAAVEVANEFSRARSEVAKATGATGQDLDALTVIVENIYGTVPESIENIAKVTGVLSTATGLQGQALQDLTRLTMDYARVNNEDASVSATNLGRLMNALNADASELGGVMEMLTMASQETGIGVNELTQHIINAGPSFEEMGFGIERSIALFSQYYKAGANPAEITGTLNKALTKLAREGSTDAEGAFSALVQSIADAPDIMSATVIAADAFGARVGSKIAEDIRAGRFEVDEFADALKNSQGTIAETAEAAMTLEDKWNTATNAMNAAMQSVFGPTVEGMSELLSELVGGVAEFIENNPDLVKGIMAFVGVLGAVIVALTAYTVVVKLAAAMSAVFQASLGPIMWAAMAVAALVGAFVALSSAMEGARNEYDELSASSKQQHDEMKELERQYNALCDAGRETSTEAQLLKRELDAATEAYEANKISAEDLAAAHQEVADSYRELRDAQAESIIAANKEGESLVSLANEYNRLAAIENRSPADNERLLAVTELLSRAIPELSDAYDIQTDSLNLTSDAVRRLAEEERARLNNQAQYEAMLELMEKEAELESNLETAKNNRAAAERALADAQQALEERDAYLRETQNERAYTSNRELNLRSYTRAVAEAQAEVDRLLETENEAQSLYDENESAIDEYAESIANYGAEVREAEAAAEAANAAIGSMAEATEWLEGALNDLAERYDAAYDSAYRSVSGQFGLWDKAAEVIPANIQEIGINLDSQKKYWDSYGENIDAVLEIGEGIPGLAEYLASFADGSPESAALIAALAESNAEDIEQMVTDWQEVQEQWDEVADKLAQLTVDVAAETDAIVSEFEAMVDEMDMTEEAAAAGTNTIQGFIDGAELMNGAVRTAFGDIGRAAISALEAALRIESPSKEMALRAEMTWAGFINQTYEEQKDVEQAFAETAEAGADAVTQMSVVSFSPDFSQLMAAHGGGGAPSFAISIEFNVDAAAARDPVGLRMEMEPYIDRLVDEVVERIEELQHDNARRGY